MSLDPLSVGVGFLAAWVARWLVVRVLTRRGRGAAQAAPQRFECDMCPKTFPSRDRAIAHVEDDHNAPDRETAEDCVVVA